MKKHGVSVKDVTTHVTLSTNMTLPINNTKANEQGYLLGPMIPLS